MTLDFIVWTPEVFLLFQLLVLLWYGSGVLTSPVQEQVGFFQIYGKKEASVSNVQQEYFKQKQTVSNILTPIAGPLHVSSHLNGWAITLCQLTQACIWYSPFFSVQTGGFFFRDLFVLELQTFVWIFQALCLAVSHSWQKSSGICHLEYVYLVLFFLMGAHLLLMCTDLISLYACLELQSFSVVVLCSLNYVSAYAIEAGMKYFLLSQFSSCLLLLGIGLVYWQTGLTKLSSLQELLSQTTTSELLSDGTQMPVWLGLWLIGLALLWKLAAAPLHMWAADVYQGQWSSVTLLISTIPKIAVLGFWVHSFSNLWTTAFGSGMAFFSGLSMVIGQIQPLAQTQLKRLLQFSSVAHMGFLLMPFTQADSAYGFSALWAYLFLYLITSLAIWGLMQWPFSRPSTQAYSAHYVKQSGPQYIWDLVGLNLTSPAAQIAWAVAMLSLAGLPPVQGFLGKLYLFWASLSADQYFLVLLALLSTLLGSVYYLRLIVVSFVYNKGNWGSYGSFYPMSAYLIVGSLLILILGLWYQSPLILASHLLALTS